MEDQPPIREELKIQKERIRTLEAQLRHLLKITEHLNSK